MKTEGIDIQINIKDYIKLKINVLALGRKSSNMRKGRIYFLVITIQS